MKRCCPILILLCLLLAGCSGKAEETAAPVPTEAVPVSAAPPAGFHDPDNPLQAQYNGALRAYPLDIPGVTGMKTMGSDVLIFSDTDVSTVITRLSGEELYIAATVRLGFPLGADDPSVRVTDSAVSFFDPVNRQTVVLDGSLKEIMHIPAPEDLVGTPLLSDSRDALYYCTETGIYVRNLENGISRIIKEACFASQSVTGLQLNDTVLQCLVSVDEGDDRTLLLSTENGQLLYEGPGDMTMTSRGSSYYLSFPDGCIQAMVFGQGEGSPRALTPAELSGEGYFLESFADAVTACAGSDGEIRLDYYDLDTGLRSASLTIPGANLPVSVEKAADSLVYILTYDMGYGRETVYRWDPDAAEFAVSDETVYTRPW